MSDHCEEDHICPEHDSLDFDIEEAGYYCQTCDCCFGCYEVGCTGCGEEEEEEEEEDTIAYLAMWVQAQKVAYKNGNLKEWQITSLETVPGWTWEM